MLELMKLNRYILGMVLVIGLAGCKKDFLEKAPLDTINTDNFYKTADDAIAAVNGAYQPLQWPKLYNMRMWTSDIMAGNSEVGAGGGQDGIETQHKANFITTPENAGVLDLWRGPFPGILRSNIVLDKVPSIEMDPVLKNRVLGEAKFLRGHYYFILVRYFGDVPLILQPLYPGDDLRPARTPKDQVYQQIIKDLEEAATLLPPRQQYSGGDIGRASKGSALGMLAKVHLTLGNWQKVIELTDQVKALGYALNEQYGDNFNPLTENSKESLFEVQYNKEGKYDFWSNENQASWTSTFTGPRNANFVEGGWGWNQPTQEFVSAYEPGDLRKDVTILYEGGPKYDGKDYKKSFSLTGYNLRKFLVPRSMAPTYDKSPLNFPVLRYSDVLLMRAEALNELGKAGDAQLPASDPNATLNKVRARAGLANVSGLGQAALREKILHERRMELAFEGQRWFDLVRVNNGQWGLNFLHSIGKTNATAKHLLLPIPQQERDVNPNLTQNPGY